MIPPSISTLLTCAAVLPITVTTRACYPGKITNKVRRAFCNFPLFAQSTINFTLYKLNQFFVGHDSPFSTFSSTAWAASCELFPPPLNFPAALFVMRILIFFRRGKLSYSVLSQCSDKNHPHPFSKSRQWKNVKMGCQSSLPNCIIEYRLSLRFPRSSI